ncbi:MAG: hypothetical protein RR346_02525 [Bacteroidales bacterium]
MKHFFPFLLILICCTGCKDYADSVIPSTKVESELNLLTTDLELATPGGFKVISARTTKSPYIGYGGLLVVRGYLDDVVYAYDLACPAERNPEVKIRIENGIKAVCPKCGSEFDGIFYGSTLPSAGKAKNEKLFLRQYC